MVVNPKTLLFDIETLPNLCFTWGVGKQYVGYENIHKERKIACICYKWLGEAPIYSLAMDMSLHNLNKRDDDADRKLLADFAIVYRRADLAVGHNSIAFDKAIIRSRLVKYKMPDITPVIMDDTYIQTKGIGFTSHKLDYISQYLGLGEKKPHPYKLWKDVMGGSKQALLDMVDYCKGDVRLEERVYKWLLPYMSSKFNRAVFAGDPTMCPSCGEKRLRKEGTRSLLGGLKQKWVCMSCGHPWTSPLKPLDKAKEFLR